MPIDDLSCIRIGSEYGGWWVPKAILRHMTLPAICVGAGEDISLDLELTQYFDEVSILDPTKLAINHFGEMISHLLSGDNYYTKPDKLNYLSIRHKLSNVKFLPIGVGGKNGIVDFYPPKNPAHASFSSKNIQKTHLSPIKLSIVDADGLSKLLGTNSPALLKLDIEGAEIDFLNTLIKSKFRPLSLLVELDLLAWNRNNPTIVNSVQVCLQSLALVGYKLIRQEGNNLTYIYANNTNESPAYNKGQAVKIQVF